MKTKKSNTYRKIWTTPNFHKFLYEKKAETPNKTLLEIQDEITESLREQQFKPNEKKKKYESPFFPKL